MRESNPKRRRNYIHIRSRRRLANPRQHIRKADFRGHISVHRNLGDLRIHKIHPRHRRLRIANAFVKPLQNFARPRVRFPDQNKIRIQKIPNHATERNKFRRITKPKIHAANFPASRFQFRPHRPAGSPRHDGARKHHNMKFLLPAQSMPHSLANRQNMPQRKSAIPLAGRPNNNKSDFRFRDSKRSIRSSPQ